jgi:hypothetical protein
MLCRVHFTYPEQANIINNNASLIFYGFKWDARILELETVGLDFKRVCQNEWNQNGETDVRKTD